jgi:nucleotidyltransferase-like protein
MTPGARAVLLTGSTAEGVADEYSDLDVIVDGRDPGSTQHKALIGILQGRPLHGADLTEQWQARHAQLPDALARAMVEHYLRQTMPLWYFADALDRHFIASLAIAHRTSPSVSNWLWVVIAGAALRCSKHSSGRRWS